jgi:hypothetical protein
MRPRQGGPGGRRKRRVVIDNAAARPRDSRQQRDREAPRQKTPREVVAPSGPVTVPSGVTVRDLSQALGVPAPKIIMFMMGLGKAVTITQTLADDEVLLVAAELAPYETEGAGRLRIGNAEVQLESAKAVALGLAVNELATNALKYGALSTPSGQLDVDWHVVGQRLVLEWRESDGPDVRAHAIENFGSRLLKRLVEGQLHGSIHRELSEKGVTCVVSFPLATQASETPA